MQQHETITLDETSLFGDDSSRTRESDGAQEPEADLLEHICAGFGREGSDEGDRPVPGALCGRHDALYDLRRELRPVTRHAALRRLEIFRYEGSPHREELGLRHDPSDPASDAPAGDFDSAICQ